MSQFRRPPPPTPGVSPVSRRGDPMAAIMAKTSSSLIEEATRLLNKAAAIDPMMRPMIADALAELGHTLREDDDDEDTEPRREAGPVVAPTRRDAY